MLPIRHWLDFLFPPRGDEIAVHNVSIDAFLARMAPKLTPVTRPATVALLPFHDISVRSAIHEVKYHGTEHAFTLLAALLAEYLRNNNEGFRKTVRLAIPAAQRTGHWRTNTMVFCWTRMRPPPHTFNFGHSSSPQSERGILADASKPIIIPIPLGKKRRAERGFNQIEDIIQRAVNSLDIAIDTTLLERTRETVSQVSLPRHKREANMRGAFKTTRPADPSRTYIVIDDVITTGATLQAAIDALSQAGAKYIVPLALAH